MCRELFVGSHLNILRDAGSVVFALIAETGNLCLFTFFSSFPVFSGDFSKALIFFFKETVAFAFVTFPSSFLLFSGPLIAGLSHFLVESKHNNTVLFACG